jgi:hypothetical protein
MFCDTYSTGDGSDSTEESSVLVWMGTSLILYAVVTVPALLEVLLLPPRGATTSRREAGTT